MTPVVQLSAADARPAARVLARAFQDYPMMAHLVPDPQRRAKLLPRFLGSVQRYCARYGEVAVTADLGGVACWLPPRRTEVTPQRMLRTGMVTTVPRLGARGMARFARLIPVMERTHHAAMPEPHWYLWLLATEPARRSQGIGGTLLAPTLTRADRAGLPVYLETHSEATLGFYGRYGFEPVVDEVANGLRFWGLRRPSASPVPE